MDNKNSILLVSVVAIVGIVIMIFSGSGLSLEDSDAALTGEAALFKLQNQNLKIKAANPSGNDVSVSIVEDIIDIPEIGTPGDDIPPITKIPNLDEGRSCTDLDENEGNVDIEVPNGGFITYAVAGEVHYDGAVFPDVCYDEVHLEEYYCNENGMVQSVVVTCSLGCDAAACQE